MGSQNEEPTLLGYARHYGLTRDHTLDDISDIVFYVPPHGDIETALADPNDVPLFPPIWPPVNLERIAIDAPSKHFLASVLRLAQLSYDFDEIPVHSSFDSWKLETPLLFTDPDVDMLSVKRRPVDLSLLDASQVDPVPADEDKDEGLSWSAVQMRLPKEYDRQCREEKISVTREAMLWLQMQLKLANTDVDLESAFDAGTHFKRKQLLLTPPESPSRIAKRSNIASSPSAMNLPLAPEYSSPTVYLQNSIENTFMQDDSIAIGLPSSTVVTPAKLTAIYSPLRLGSKMNSSSPAPMRATKLKMEDTLSSPALGQIAAFSSDSLTDMIATGTFPIHFAVRTMSSDDVPALLNQNFKPCADVVEHKVCHEELSQAESSLHLREPEMVFDRPDVPWKSEDPIRDCKDEQDALLSLIKKRRLHKLPVGMIEKDLPWNPFNNLSVQSLFCESLEDDEALHAFLERPDQAENLNYDSFSWKPEGLRILDDNAENDEELQPAFGYPSDTSDGLFRKRKLDFPEPSTKTPEHLGPSTTEREISELLINPELQADLRNFHQANGRSNSKNVSEALTGQADLFSAAENLDHFIDVQIGHVQKRKKVNGAQPVINTALKPNVEDPITNGPSVPHANRSPERCGRGEEHFRIALPVSENAIFGPIIMSLSFLATNRRLFLSLVKQAPNLQVIEREFCTIRKSNAESRGPGCVPDDPDILISPSTAIIFTTTQKASQKPLPGTGSYSPLQKRILAVSATCERCVILVSPASSTSFSDERDAMTLADLTSFCTSASGLKTAAFEVLCVPSEPTILAHYVIALLACEMVDAPRWNTSAAKKSFELLQDETTWELFLRRTGMNAFAAQVVLAELKAPPDIDNLQANARGLAQPDEGAMNSLPLNDAPPSISVPSSFPSGIDDIDTSLRRGPEESHGSKRALHGLPAFLAMTPGARRDRFAALLGGTKVLDRVGAVLNQPWRRRKNSQT